jgi:hypothetical protein
MVGKIRNRNNRGWPLYFTKPKNMNANKRAESHLMVTSEPSELVVAPGTTPLNSRIGIGSRRKDVTLNGSWAISEAFPTEMSANVKLSNRSVRFRIPPRKYKAPKTPRRDLVLVADFEMALEKVVCFTTFSAGRNGVAMTFAFQAQTNFEVVRVEAIAALRLLNSIMMPSASVLH